MRKNSYLYTIWIFFRKWKKTTLLKQFIQEDQRKNKKIRVIMNEVGEISIDSNEIPAETPFL
ncbi:hypothetical protein GCM10020331_005150 [Ectobacillus funiculus]